MGNIDLDIENLLTIILQIMAGNADFSYAIRNNVSLHELYVSSKEPILSLFRMNVGKETNFYYLNDMKLLPKFCDYEARKKTSDCNIVDDILSIILDAVSGKTSIISKFDDNFKPCKILNSSSGRTSIILYSNGFSDDMVIHQEKDPYAIQLPLDRYQSIVSTVDDDLINILYSGKDLKHFHNDAAISGEMGCRRSKKNFEEHTEQKRLRGKGNDYAKLFVCQHCGKSFKRKDGLKNHVAIHIGRKPYECAQCHKCFTQVSSLRAHESVHVGDKPYQCKYCGKFFRSKKSVKEHARIHTGERPYKCQHCDKTFIRAGDMTAHKLVHIKPYHCQYCERRFSKKVHWRDHESTHTGLKRYKCLYCEKCFFFPSCVKTHERIHTGEKPYKCEHCDKSFNQLHAKKSHELLHRGQKPYECKFCGRIFFTREQLFRHEVIHNGPKPYKCSYCEKSFSRLGNAKKHEIKHHTSL